MTSYLASPNKVHGLALYLTLAIQVQVLTRDLAQWLKDYREYLNGADVLIAGLKNWVTYEKTTKIMDEDSLSWKEFCHHMATVSTSAFPFLEKTIQAKCIQSLEVYPAKSC
jgi:hypothetical protein